MNEKSRTYNSVKNVSIGLIVTVLNTIISFVNRTFLVKYLGVEILGLNGLFTEIIAVISLTEMGVGMAIVYSLYKPIRENDRKKISQLMSLFRKAYNVIAVVTLAVGLLLLPFVHLLITDIDYPIDYIRKIYLLFIIKTTCSYLFAYKTSLLNADQKQFIVSVFTMLFRAVFTAITILLLYFYGNFYLYLFLQIAQVLLTNIVLSLYVTKKYPFLNRKDNLEKSEKKSIFSDIKNLFIKRVSGVITSSTDNILISVLVSTVQVGLYSNYVMIFSLARTLKLQLSNGVSASIGNLVVSSAPEKCSDVLLRLTFLFFVFGVIICGGLLAVTNSFIEIWLGADFLLDNGIVYLAILNLFIEICCEPLWLYLEASGLFKQDKYIAILGSIVNLAVSIALGYYYGIVGIFIGTLCTQVIQLILKTLLIYKRKFGLSPWSYFYSWAKVAAGFLFVTIGQVGFISVLDYGNLYLLLVLQGLVSIVFSVSAVILTYYRTEELNYLKNLFKALFAKLKRRVKC